MEQGQITRLKGYLPDYLRQKGLPLRKPFRCLSPDHEDKHPSMSFHAASNTVRCFACGASYDLFDLIGQDYGLHRFPQRLEHACQLFAPSLLWERTGEQRPQELTGSPGSLSLEWREEELFSSPATEVLKARCGERGGPAESLAAPAHSLKEAACVERDLEPAGKAAELLRLQQSAGSGCPYLRSRGIGEGSVRRYGLFEQEDRVYLPVWEKGQCTGWCARATREGAGPRYKNSPGALGLWNGDLLAQQGGGERLFVTEGIIDALSLEELGCRAIALCGAQNTGKFRERCRENPATLGSWRFVLCGDGDEAGRRMNRQLRQILEELGLDCRELEAPGEEDWNGLLRRDRAGLAALLAGLDQEEDPARDYGGTSAAAGLDAFFEQRERRAGRDGVPTGLGELDKLLDGGLYPGLYVMGAISSLGKTSLALQMADHIAAAGRDVLFFSLEQSRFELMAKSLSRLSAQLAQGCAPFTARQLLSGEPAGSMARQQLLYACREAYGAVAGRLFLRESLGDTGAADVRRMVEEHRRARGQAPVVVVDYLQILAPGDRRASDKQNVDRAVVELKRISRDFDVPVLAVSSFNRESYRAAVSMEAFKESGAVEYSADVLLGLQLQGAGSRELDWNKAKLETPRRLELVILKNRSGLPYARVPLSYDARYSAFSEGRVRAVQRVG